MSQFRHAQLIGNEYAIPLPANEDEQAIDDQRPGEACKARRIFTGIAGGVTLPRDGVRHNHRHRRPADKTVEYGGKIRSEEHTSELQSLMRISYAVFCLKKKITILKTPVRNKSCK